VHGIRTFGGWQERLEMILRRRTGAERQLTVVNYKFGYFSALAFLSVVLRWYAVRRFRAELLALTRAPWDRIDLVAHSFGTFLAAKSLAARSSSHVHIDNLILAGSVLPDYFRWSRIVPDRVASVVNECGDKDNVLLLSQALPLLGMAGRTGFRGMTGNHLRNRYFSFGHGGYFLDRGKPCDDFMRENWVPIILEGREAPPVDQRSPGGLTGVKAFLLNNSRPIKLVTYILLIALLYSKATPLATSVYASQLISREKGYISKDKHGAKVWFDENAEPTKSIRWLVAVGPISELDLDGTHVTDTEIGELPRDDSLAVLKLGKTKLTHYGLHSLSQFPQLKRLTLFDDALGSLDGFPKLPKLETLDLENTGIRDRDLELVSKLTTLRNLNISGNSIEGPGLRNLSSLTKLSELVLDDTSSLDDGSLENLPPLPSLTKLSLSGLPINGFTLIHLGQFERLSSLDLSYSDIRDSALSHLPELPQLRELMLTGVNVDGSGFGAVGHLNSLEELWLKDTHVTNIGLTYLSGLKRLRILALPGTKITSGGLVSLAGLPALEELYLGGTEVSDRDLSDLRLIPRLRVVYLPQNPQITDAGLLALREVKGLVELNIERTGTTKLAQEEFRKARPGVKLEI
jgi:Leucine-rich repeat (LRR) protein